MPVLAPLIIGGVAAAGSIASGVIGAGAAKNAANLQYQASQNALDFQKSVYANNQNTLSPFINAGTQATSTLAQLTGGGTNTPNYSSFMNSPDYQFAQTQGMKGLTNYENAQGMGLSGGALRDVSSFNQGLATQQYGNYFSRLMQIATLGGNAAGSLAGNNTNMAGTIGNTTMAGGQAQASGIVGSANAITGGIGSGINNSLFAAALGSNPSAYKGLNGLFSGGSSGGGGGGTGFSLTGTGGLY